jgi:hypothetical protein
MKSKMNYKIYISVITASIILLVAIFAWPKNIEKVSQSNPIDDSKTQVRINVKRINIREMADVNSKDIGDVYYDEVYTVLDNVNGEDYYWYKIKTNTGIEGYIASSKETEYVVFISGYIDRTPPAIESKKILLFPNGKEDYSGVSCTDEYSECSLSFKKKDNLYVDIIAVDEAGNKSVKTVNYYNTYKSYSKFSESNKNLSISYTKTLTKNKLVLTVEYTLHRQIPKDSKSISYSTIVNLFDEDMNDINDIDESYNSIPLSSKCINDERMLLKDKYLETNLSVTDKICFNYTIPDSSKVKYFEIGLQGVENYEKKDNYLANYSSRLYELR